jgi:uncharacterized membrane protein YdjX (TVP38/TMEM64 family)
MSKPRKSLVRPIALAVLLIALMVSARVFNLGDRLGELREWIHSLGALGPFVYVFVYAAGVVLAVPGSLITIMAGVLFGSLLGIVVVSFGSTLGASLAFLISRHIAREAVAERFSRNEKFRRLDRMTHDHGPIIVAITRLVPLFPFNLLNFGFGLTQVPFKTYVFWSWLCMLPGTVLYVVGSDAVAKAVSEGTIPWSLIGVFAVTVVIIILLVKHARRKLHAKESETGDETQRSRTA